MGLLWTYIKKVSTGMVDEKVTVISSVVHTYIHIVHTKAKLEVEMGSVLIFLLLKLGTP